MLSIFNFYVKKIKKVVFHEYRINKASEEYTKKNKKVREIDEHQKIDEGRVHRPDVYCDSNISLEVVICWYRLSERCQLRKQSWCDRGEARSATS